MSSFSEPELRAKFDAAFIFPFAGYAWQSERGRECWIDLELLQDFLAGPVSRVVEHGECAYVYEREDECFSGVNDPAALHARLRHWRDELTSGLDGFAPATPAEADDLTSMRLFASEMWAVAEQAMDIERTRWDADDPKSD